MSEPEKATTASIELVARIDPDDLVRGLSNNDGLLLPFILEMLDHAGSSELEEDLLLRLQERLGLLPKVEVPNEG